jgi:hypothetical protein
MRDQTNPNVQQSAEQLVDYSNKSICDPQGLEIFLINVMSNAWSDPLEEKDTAICRSLLGQVVKFGYELHIE